MNNEVAELRKQIDEMKSQMKSQMSTLKSEQQKKINIIVRMQGEIRTDLLDIKSNMQFLSESVTALISSSMDEILNKFRERSVDNVVGASDPLDQVEKTVDVKGKSKMDPADAFFPSGLEAPSFDLGIGYTQPTQPEIIKDSDVQAHVDSIISNVLKETESAANEASLVHPPSSGLPVKRAPRPAKALQSPYAIEVKQTKAQGKVVVFEKYNQNVDDCDVSDFQNWFQRGYKPNNKKKFNDKDDPIKPPFVVGQFLVGNKIWWYELVSREVSLSSSHMDVCFYFIRQLARDGQNVKFSATTTDTLFQAKLKNIYQTFKHDPSVVATDSRLIEDITGARIPLSTAWAYVNLVFMPILPTNKAHWMLAVLDVKKQLLLVFNSSRKTYNDIKVLAGIEPFVKIIPHLMKAVGIWKELVDLEVKLDFSLPQQKNGHDCGIYVVKYAEYMLHNDIGSMPMNFDADRARLDLASLLFKHREIRKATKKAQLPGGKSIVIE